MVAPLDNSPKLTATGPKGAAALAKPAEKPSEKPAIAGDGLTLSKPAEGPTLGTSYKIEGGKIYASDTVKIDADPERVMAALEGDWSKWWPSGAVEGVPCDAALPKPEENEKRFLFRELAAKGAPKAGYVVQQFMATAEQAGGGALMMVVPTKLSGDLKGDARYEIRVLPDGKTLLTSKWDGVKPAGLKGVGPLTEGTAKAHLALEERALKNLETWLKANP